MPEEKTETNRLLLEFERSAKNAFLNHGGTEDEFKAEWPAIKRDWLHKKSLDADPKPSVARTW